ncbi:methyl-accepting chemotaxis protein [Roseimarinus sediminis]|uniref:methyl-accepting chemotaxis protein n=1 Tax=Roseimarinus sediminis TaxID=1610899 RepID=UPI003D1F0BAD
MKLKTRFFLLFTVIALTFTAIGWYTHLSFNSIRKLNQTDKEVHQLYSLSLELKQHENNFIRWDLRNPQFFQNGRSIHIIAFNDAINNSESICNELLNNQFINKINSKEKISQISSLLESYRQSFHNYTKSTKEMGFKDWGTVGIMRTAIHNVEEEIAKTVNKPMSVHMLTLRRHEKDYLLRRDLSYRIRFENELQAFSDYIQGSGISKRKKEQLLKLLEEYHQSFLLVLERDKNIGISLDKGLTKTLNNTSLELNKAIEHVNALISNKTEQYIQRAKLLLFIFIIGCTLTAMIIISFIVSGMYKLMGGEPETVAILAKRAAEGKLKIEKRYRKKPSGVLQSVIIMTDQLSSIISEIYHNADQLVLASQHFTNSAHQLSSGATAQASTVDQISDAIEIIGNKISKNSSNASAADEYAERVRSEINQVKAVTDHSLQTSQAIGDKISLIESIANQTTILALNAAVEAARSGDKGSGFKVIADEIKRLSQISREAAETIKNTTEVQLDVSATISKGVDSLLKPINSTSLLARDISMLSNEQETHTLQVKQAVSHLLDFSQENAAASQEMAASASELERQAKELIRLVAYFNSEN